MIKTKGDYKIMKKLYTLITLVIMLSMGAIMQWYVINPAIQLMFLDFLAAFPEKELTLAVIKFSFQCYSTALNLILVLMITSEITNPS